MIIKSSTRTHAGSLQVNSEIGARLAGKAEGPVSDSAALAVASWYACPTTGTAFAQLATTGSADSNDLIRDIGRAASGRTGLGEAELNELLALFAWVTTRPGVEDDLL